MPGALKLRASSRPPVLLHMVMLPLGLSGRILLLVGAFRVVPLPQIFEWNVSPTPPFPFLFPFLFPIILSCDCYRSPRAA